jgi:hypothetical protein
MDYWTSTVVSAEENSSGFRLHIYMGIIPYLEVSRNNLDDAHQVHRGLKTIVEREELGKWATQMPDPVPPDGYSPDAARKLTRLGLTELGYSFEMGLSSRIA